MRRHYPACLCLFLCLLTATPGHARGAEYWLRISLNHETMPWFARVFSDEQGRYYFRLLDLITLGIPMDEQSLVHDDGEHFHAISDVPGYRIRIDPAAGYAHVIQEGAAPLVTTQGILLVDLDVDGGPEGSGPVAVENRNGMLLVPATALHELGIRTDNLPAYEGNISIESLVGDDYVFDSRTMRLWFRVAPERRSGHRIVARHKPSLSPLRGVPSGSLSYDISGGNSEHGDDWRTILLGGNYTQDFGYCRSRTYQAGDDAPWRRLDSYCGYDWPARVRSLLVGDAISRADSLGQAVRYGGIRFGTDYALTPTANLQPDMMLSGTARVPSVLELWVNQTLTLKRPVGPGPIVIDQIPTLSGAGDIHLVLQDALGRREEVYRPYYTDPRLLRAGLSDWSVEAGRLREGYGIAGDGYTDAVTVMGGRYGARDWLTLTGRAEYQQDAFFGTGISATLRAGTAGILEAGAMASSGHDGGHGSLLELALSRRTGLYSLGLRWSMTSAGFQQLGYDAPGSAPKHRAQASAGVQLPARMSLSLAAFHEAMHDGTATTLYTAGFSRRVLRKGQLSFNAVIPESREEDNFYGLSLVIALGKLTSVSAGMSRQNDATSERFNLQKSLPVGSGIGYRIEGRDDSTGTSVAAATVQGQNDRAYLEFNATESNGTNSVRGRLTGGLLMTEEGIRTIRKVDNAAIVHIPAPGVRVYRDNQVADVTDSDGNAVLFGLRPYEANRIRFAPEDLPMNASASSSELVLAPGRYQTVLAGFAVDVESSITANLVDEAGNFLPAGARIFIDDKAIDAVLGNKGLIYLRQDAPRDTRVQVQWADHQCSVTIPAPPTNTATWNAGQITCRENGT